MNHYESDILRIPKGEQLRIMGVITIDDGALTVPQFWVWKHKRTHTYIYTYIFTNIHIYAHIHTYIHACIHAYMHTCMHTPTCILYLRIYAYICKAEHVEWIYAYKQWKYTELTKHCFSQERLSAGFFQ